MKTINLEYVKQQREYIDSIYEIKKIGFQDICGIFTVITTVNKELKGDLKFTTSIIFLNQEVKTVNLYSNKWYAIAGHNKWLERVKSNDFDFSKYYDLLSDRRITKNNDELLDTLIKNNKELVKIAKKLNFYDLDRKELTNYILSIEEIKRKK